MMSDASDMLAAALEQMDGIIAGQSYLFQFCYRQNSEELFARKGLLNSFPP